VVSPESVRVVFMGTAAFAVPSLEALVKAGYRVVAAVSRPPRPAGRGRKLTLPPVTEAAERLGLPVLTPEKLRAPEVLQQLAALRPDVIVVAAYAQFLPRSLLETPAHGCVNVHGSLLPRWRGASPIHAAILAGDEFTGVTVMRMAEAMDSGPILAQIVTRIEDSDATPDLEMRLAGAGANLLVSTLPCYLSGAIRPVIQEESLATFAPLIRKEDGLIDWSLSAEQIWRASRAYRAWPGSYSFWKGRMLKLLACRPEPELSSREEAGRVVPLDGGREVGVATGKGILRLEEVALEGSRPMGIREFLAGHRDFMGSRLGSESGRGDAATR